MSIFSHLLTKKEELKTEKKILKMNNYYEDVVCGDKPSSFVYFKAELFHNSPLRNIFVTDNVSIVTKINLHQFSLLYKIQVSSQSLAIS